MFDHQSGSLTAEFFIRFLANNVCLLVLLRVVYYRTTLQRDAMCGFLLFGNGLFIVTALLANVEVSMGFTLGLFAVFGLLRYRTETLTTVEMAYLFVAIAISLMSAVSRLNVGALFIVNGLMCALAVFGESTLLAPRKLQKNIVYEKIDLVHPARMEELRHDLQQRTGLLVERIEVGDMDFLKDSTMLKVHFASGKQRLAPNEKAGQGSGPELVEAALHG